MVLISEAIIEQCSENLLPSAAFEVLPDVLNGIPHLEETWGMVKWALKLIETGDDMTNGLKKMVDLLRTCFRILHRCIKQEFEKSHKEEWKWLSYLCVNQNDWVSEVHHFQKKIYEMYRAHAA